MSSRRKPKLPADKRRELQVTSAVVREAVLTMHVARALNLIELIGTRVSAMRMLGIYIRVHDLSNVDADVVSNRLLALLGRRARRGQPALVYTEGTHETNGSRTLVGVVRERLRGRQLNDVRRVVEIHAGSTRAAVLEIHVRHALRFVKELTDTHAIPDALEVYLELVAVPNYMHDALYIFVLDALAEEELPRAAPVALANGGAEKARQYKTAGPASSAQLVR